MNIILTGGAGFIGSHLLDYLLDNSDHHVVCIDNFDGFYSHEIKERNIAKHLGNKRFKLIREDICNFGTLDVALNGTYDMIIHLAAKAGVRPSIENPFDYNRVNVLGTQCMLELAKKRKIRKFIFSSSSSVYGINNNVPWREDDNDLKPISPYAASKISCELMGHTYAHLYGMQFIALRLFTVFGPRQRPDLAIHKFVKAISEGSEIYLFGDGTTRRDYTYVGDIIKGIDGAIQYDKSDFEIFNLGNNQTVMLSELIDTIEKMLNAKAIIKRLHEQPGDVPTTYADISKSASLLGYKPETGLSEGISGFVNWYKNTIGSKK